MSQNIVVTLPDGSKKEAPRGVKIHDFVKDSIGPGLAKAAVFARIDGQDVDLSRALDADAALQIFTTKAPEALEVARHDAAHIVADAVQRLFPGTQVTIGPTIEDGFYYDFFREKPFTPDELEAIEKKANEIVASDAPFVRSEISAEDAKKLFAAKGEKFKLEIIDDIVAKGATTLTLYTHGDWVDFCLGPHGPTTAKVGVIKMLSSSRRLLARRSPQRDAPAHLRHGVLRQEGARRLDRSNGKRPRKRDHRKLGTRAGSLPLPPLLARRRLLDAQGHGALHGAVGLHAQAGHRERLRRDQDAAALQQGALGDLGPLGQVPREHVPGAGQRLR